VGAPPVAIALARLFDGMGNLAGFGVMLIRAIMGALLAFRYKLWYHGYTQKAYMSERAIWC